MLPDNRSRTAVSVSERYADGLASKEEMSAVQGMAALALQHAIKERTSLPSLGMISSKHLGRDLEDQLYCAARKEDAARAAKGVARSTDRLSKLAEEMGQAAGWALCSTGRTLAMIKEFRARQARLLRCIFGNPFRPAALESTWITPATIELARMIYEDRDFSRMPELAIVMEESGCSNNNILDHCREPNEHVRGCWTVDLILGKK